MRKNINKLNTQERNQCIDTFSFAIVLLKEELFKCIGVDKNTSSLFRNYIVGIQQNFMFDNQTKENLLYLNKELLLTSSNKEVDRHDLMKTHGLAQDPTQWELKGIYEGGEGKIFSPSDIQDIIKKTEEHITSSGHGPRVGFNIGFESAIEEHREPHSSRDIGLKYNKQMWIKRMTENYDNIGNNFKEKYSL